MRKKEKNKELQKLPLSVDESQKKSVGDLTSENTKNAIKSLTGVQDFEFAMHLLCSASSAISSIGDKGQSFDIILESLKDFQPKDAIEARLVAQSSVLYSFAMKSIKQSGEADMLCHIEAMMNLGLKLIRAHNETVETLGRYHRGGEQRVVIQHQEVNVSDQAKAVVGNFTRGPGEGENNKNMETPHVR